MQAIVGDKFGNILGEIHPQFDTFSTILNGIGRTKMVISKNSTDFVPSLLAKGNTLYVTFDDGTPPWGGVLDLPYVWGEGEVTINCYESPYRFKTRVTDKTASFYGLSAGTIFRLVLTREENQSPMGLNMGSIWEGGDPHYPVFHHTSIWDVLDYSLRQMERCDYTFVPYITENTIKFRANFYQIAGEDKTFKSKLAEGRNAGTVTDVEERGNIINAHYAIGDGSVWDETRLVMVTEDLKSIAMYGRRETSAMYSGTSMAAMLIMQGRNVIRLNSQPRVIFRCPVTNNEPGDFSSYTLGDTVACSLPSYGFDGFYDSVRIIGRDYNPNTGVCELALEVQREPEFWIYQEDIPENT